MNEAEKKYRRPRQRQYHLRRTRLPEALLLAAFILLTAAALPILLRSLRVSRQNADLAARHQALTAQTASAVTGQSALLPERMGLPDGTPIAEPAASEEKDKTQTTAFHTVEGPRRPEMEALRARNPDLAAWLLISGVADLPVCSADNRYYLNHDFDGNTSAAGTLFLDEDHPIAKNTQHLLIHGHNMKDGTMFGLLSHYRQKAFWRAHPFISLTTLWEPEEYVIFAVMDAPLDINDRDYVNYYSHARFSSDGEFTAFIEALRVQSLIPPALDVRPSDGLLSLATCIGDRRLVVTARRIRPDETKEMLRRQIR